MSNRNMTELKIMAKLRMTGSEINLTTWENIGDQTWLMKQLYNFSQGGKCTSNSDSTTYFCVCTHFFSFLNLKLTFKNSGCLTNLKCTLALSPVRKQSAFMLMMEAVCLMEPQWTIAWYLKERLCSYDLSEIKYFFNTLSRWLLDDVAPLCLLQTPSKPWDSILDWSWPSLSWSATFWSS